MFARVIARLFRRQDGASAVEFALLVPVVVALIAGCFEASNALSVWLTLKKASEVGTRFATTGQGDQDGTRLSRIIAATQNVVSQSRNIVVVISVQSWAGITPSGTGRSGNPGVPCDTVEVRVSHNYQPITPLGSLVALLHGSTVWSAPLPMSGATKMVNEPWQPCP
uniref:Pilus assembly protein n=1 Tax=Fundidesulfovibrio putealis TaxID=270496 RepID=A0A7C4AHU0_9BACT